MMLEMAEIERVLVEHTQRWHKTIGLAHSEFVQLRTQQLHFFCSDFSLVASTHLGCYHEVVTLVDLPVNSYPVALPVRPPLSEINLCSAVKTCFWCVPSRAVAVNRRLVPAVAVSVECEIP